MIEQLHYRTESQVRLQEIFKFVKTYQDKDFYLTSENRRMSIDTFDLFLRLLNECQWAFVKHNDDEDVVGLIVVWKSLGANVSRYYVKTVATCHKDVEHLLTQLNWTVPNELFTKISTTSKILPVFQSKGFKFLGGRGDQVLLRRNKTEGYMCRSKDTEDSREESCQSRQRQ